LAGVRRKICFGSALALHLAIGWWFGFSLLLLLVDGLPLIGLPSIEFRMTPPRGDNWAGCVGVLAALAAWLAATSNRAALWLTCCGAPAGGVGFAVGDFANMLGRGQWGPIGEHEALRGLDYWKWMEQGFGLLMGLGVGLGFARLLRGNLAPPEEDAPDGPLRWIAPLFLLLIMMWQNLFKNVRTGAREGQLRDGLFGVEPPFWFLLVGVLLSAVVVLAVFRHRQGALPLAPATAFGRAQLLFLLVLWVPVLAAFLQALPRMHARGILFVHTTFWVTAGLASLIVIGLSGRPRPVGTSPKSAGDLAWSPGWKHGLLWLGVPALVFLLAWLSVRSHAEPLHGSQLRW